MRVVMLVCSVGFAGVERYLVNLAPALVARGVDVTVIGGHPERMSAALAGSGVEWMRGDDMRRAAQSLRAVPPPDILNTHMSQADILGARLRASLRGRRTALVSTRHFMGPRGGNGAARLVGRLAERRIDAEIAISAAVARYAGPATTIVHTGVASSDHTDVRGDVVLVAQRLEAEKDTATALRAWAIAGARESGWRLRIAGEGSQRTELERLAGSLGVQASVDFLGHRDDVPHLLRTSSIVLAPTSREGLGITVLEAMAEGTTVVASAGGGHDETVAPVSAELVFPAGDAASAARILDELVAAPERRRLLGAALRKRQRQFFSIDSQADATVAVYERVLRS